MGKFKKSELMNQHRSGSNNNSINFGTKIEPFRITDGVMKVGRYKGKRLSEIPRDYLEWMIRKRKHVRELQKYLDMLMIDNVNLSIQASRFGWTNDIQQQLTNSALLIRKYQRRLRLIKM